MIVIDLQTPPREPDKWERRRLAQIAATKRWKERNPDKVREQKRRWRERRARERG